MTATLGEEGARTLPASTPTSATQLQPKAKFTSPAIKAKKQPPSSSAVVDADDGFQNKKESVA